MYTLYVIVTVNYRIDDLGDAPLSVLQKILSCVTDLCAVSEYCVVNECILCLDMLESKDIISNCLQA